MQEMMQRYNIAFRDISELNQATTFLHENGNFRFFPFSKSPPMIAMSHCDIFWTEYAVIQIVLHNHISEILLQAKKKLFTFIIICSMDEILFTDA